MPIAVATAMPRTDEIRRCVADAGGQRAGGDRADHGTCRPGGVHDPEAERLRKAGRLCAVRHERDAGRGHPAHRDGGAEEERRDHERAVAQREHERAIAAIPQRPRRTGTSRPRTSLSRPATGARATSISPAHTKAPAIATLPHPASSNVSGASRSSAPKKRAGTTVSQTATANGASWSACQREIEPALAAPRVAGSRAARPARAIVAAATARKTHSYRRELRDGADRRPDDESEHSEPEGRAERLAPTFAGRRRGEPGEGPGPRHGAREALREAGRRRARRSRSRARTGARDAEQEEADDRSALRPDPLCKVARRDAAEHRPRAVGADDEARLQLAEPELSGQGGDERDDRREEHRVGEDDRADEGEEAGAHAAPRAYAAVTPVQVHNEMHRVGGSLVRPSRLTFAEATACRSGHQPQALRARCKRQSRDAESARQDREEAQFRNLRTFRELRPEPRAHARSPPRPSWPVVMPDRGRRGPAGRSPRAATIRLSTTKCTESVASSSGPHD